MSLTAPARARVARGSLSARALRRAAAGTLALVAAVAWPAHRAAAQALPSADSVLARHVAAVGGKEALMRLTSVKQLGRMEMPGVGLSADAEVLLAAPAKMVTRMTIPGIGEVMNGTDGEVAWSVNPMQGPRLLADKELAQTKEQSDFYAALTMSPSVYSSIQTVGVVDFAGEKAYKVRLVSKATDVEMFRYFSVASGLMVGYDLTTVTEMGTVSASTVVGDYKDFGGVRFATRNETTMGPQKILLTLREVVLNGAPADAFAVPEAVRPLIRK
ncbi:MAG: hypothetical protein LCH84_13675 [Gemmatimonadetes bacterium]|nr:hypothetical protein [Gemmatimonadota bacterium]